jgi:amidohydrolase
MLVGAARYLAETRNFDGTAVLIFQPGEEGFAGAKAMIEDGLFQRFPVESVYAMHNWPGLKPGTFGINHGAMMAAADRVTIEITGKGGHGAHPTWRSTRCWWPRTSSPAVQSIVSRNVKAHRRRRDQPVRHAGRRPACHERDPRQGDAGRHGAHLRPDVQDLVERRLNELCSAVALGFGATATVNYERIYPATINTPRETEFAGDVAESLVGPDHVVRDMEPSMGAEDFSFMLQVKPGAYLRIGQGGEGSCMLHNSRYDFNDDILPLGSALHASLVEQALPLAAALRPAVFSPRHTSNKEFP